MLARFMTILAAALFIFADSAFADLAGQATAHVFVDVDANIAVGALTPNVDLFGVQMGQFCGQIVFRVDANAEAVAISVAATHLYKGDDPSDPMVAPILVDTDAGATIEPTDANPIEGGDNVADFIFVYTLDGFVGWQSEYITFESSQPGYFSQDVYVTVCWDQDDPEKPQGEYSGFVTLFGNIGEL